MSESGLRSLWLQRSLVPSSKKKSMTYQPKVTYGDPFVIFQPNFKERLHLDTEVFRSQRMVRRVQNSSTALRYKMPEDTREYDIRQYPTQSNEGTLHPIVKAIDACRGCELNEMKQLLMPLQIVLHVEKKLFYTVSEEAFLSLSGFLQGVQQGDYSLCHDEIWSIVKQVLSGVKFLVSQGLQHSRLSLENILITVNGVVKIAGIDQITEERPEDWTKTKQAIKDLAEKFIAAPKKPCYLCIVEPCGSDNGQQCCDGASMLANADSLDELLDVTRALTEISISFQDAIEQTLSKAQNLPFILQAQGLRLAPITKFAWKQIHSDINPEVRPTGTTTSLSHGICQGQSPNGKKRLCRGNTHDSKRNIRQRRSRLQRPRVYPRKIRRSNRIEWTDAEKELTAV